MSRIAFQSLLRSCRSSVQPLHVPFSSLFLRPLSSAALKPVMKDPERPKRPQSSWLSFLADFRTQEPVKELARISPPEVLKLASLKWKTMSADEKKRYEESGKEAAEEYKKAMTDYTTSGKKAAWKRDPDRPKKPMTGFLRFTMAFGAKNPELTKVSERAILAAEAWANISPEHRAPYEEQYKKDHATYLEAMRQYKESGKEEAWKTKVGISSKELLAKKLKEAQKQQLQLLREKKKAKLAKTKELAKKKELKLKADLKAKVQIAKAKEAAQKEKAKATKLAAIKKKLSQKASSSSASDREG